MEYLIKKGYHTVNLSAAALTVKDRKTHDQKSLPEVDAFDGESGLLATCLTNSSLK